MEYTKIAVIVVPLLIALIAIIYFLVQPSTVSYAPPTTQKNTTSVVSTTVPVVSTTVPLVSTLDPSKYTYKNNDGTVSGDTYCAGIYEAPDQKFKNLSCVSGIDLNTNTAVACDVLGGSDKKLAYQCGDIIQHMDDNPLGTCLSSAPDSKCSNKLVGGKYTFAVAADGNIIMYSTLTGVSHQIWSSGVYGKGVAPYNLYMQSDGNLVEYDADHVPIWSTNTNGSGMAPYKFVVRVDGNAAIIDATGKATWVSNTAGQ